MFHNSTFYSLNTSYGRPGLTRKIVASYLMTDGTRFTDKAGWQTMEFRDECQNRDPRLAQSIRTPGYTRINSTKIEVPSLSTCMTGYQPIKFVAPADFGSDGYNLSYTDLPIIRTAEIYLNYAEAKAEPGHADAGRHRPDDQEACATAWACPIWTWPKPTPTPTRTFRPLRQAIPT